ncbi:MAG TPA: TonB-dependent receptor [Chryseolinea sp.]|nr:TonB-dependent receptor [Chryseolinea sp.]
MTRKLLHFKLREIKKLLGRAAAFGILFSLLQVTQLYAQTIVNGKITSSDDGATLPGVNVVIKGTTTGTTSGSDGTYRIDAPSDATLVFSFVGYATSEVVVGQRTTIDVVLQTDITGLDEVVVIGYGSVKKTDLTGAVSLVDPKELTKVNTNNVTQMLQGRVAGVAINSDGQPGASPKVTIRGVSTFGTGGTDSEPLYVVDGLPLGGTTGSTGDRAQPTGTFNPIRDINPNDIESIQVLKDASAGAIYGVRAANGVVIITTKKGRLNQPLKVDLNAYYGVQNVGTKIPVTQRENYQMINRETFINGGVPQNIPPGNDPNSPLYIDDIDTDWQEEGLTDGSLQNVNIAFAGGGNNTTYFASLDYFKNTGTLVGNGPDYERYSVKVNTDTKKGAFRFGQNLYVTQSDETSGLRVSGIPGANPPFINDLIWAAPTIPVYDPNRKGGYGGSSGSIENSLSLNIIGLNSMVDNSRITFRTITGAYGELDFFKNFTYKLNLQYDYTQENNELFVPEYDLGFFFPNGSAFFEKGMITRTSGLVENTVSYKKVLGKHNIDLLGGVTFQNFAITDVKARTSQLTEPYVPTLSNGNGTKTVSEVVNRNSLFSLLGRINYNYADKYFITANIRRDGSSKFSEDNRYAVFPSVAVAWKLHNEFTMPEFIDELKIRGGWGKLGNQAIPNYAFQPTLNANVTYSFNDTRVFGTAAIAAVDPNLQWEKRSSSNVAMDVRLFNSIDFTLEYYSNKAEDIIVAVPLPLSVGALPASLLTNSGSMRNTGFEFSMSYAKSFGDFFIDIAPNFYTVKNEVLAIGPGSPTLDDLGARTVVGGSLGRQFGWVYDGIFQTTEEVSDHAFQNGGTAPGDIRFKDLNNDNVINDEDRTFIGDAIPDFYYGLNLTAEYKHFDFTFFASGSSGGVAVNNMYRGLMSSQSSGNTNYHEDILGRWTPSATNTDVPRMIYLDPNLNGRPSDRPEWLQKTNYLRLNTISIGYSLSPGVLERIKITKARFYITGQNLHTFTPYKGFNPDFQTISILAPGFDFGTYPRPRTYMVGMQLSF